MDVDDHEPAVEIIVGKSVQESPEKTNVRKDVGPN